jgi:outer membrane protein
MTRRILICLCMTMLLTTPLLAQGPVTANDQSVSLLQALQFMLERHPQVQIQREQVSLSRGTLQIERGQFDPTLSGSFEQAHSTTPLTSLQELQSTEFGINASSDKQNTSALNLAATESFRNGITFGPTLTDTRTTDALLEPNGLNEGQLAFQISLPLLQGRGRAAVDAREIAANFALGASMYQLNQTIATLLLQTATAYWNDRAALRNLQIAHESETRGEQFLRDTRLLVDAGRVATGELYQLTANLEQRRSLRVSAEQTVLSAGQSLAVAMGWDPDEILQTPSAGDEFPQADLQPPSEAAVRAGIQVAFENRGDLLALARQEQSAEALLPAARNGLLPRLNLSLSGGYTGLFEGVQVGHYLAAPFQGVEGLNATATLTYTFPMKNNVARGQLVQALSNRNIARLQSLDTRRSIASGVLTAWGELFNSRAQVTSARASIAAFRSALAVEKQKFPLGRSTLIELLTTEDRLTTAEQEEVAAELAYALALANFRYATGTIIKPDQPVQTVDRRIFVSVPDFVKQQVQPTGDKDR